MSRAIFLCLLASMLVPPGQAESQTGCRETGSLTSCCTCTRHPTRLLCRGTCSPGLFPAPEMMPFQGCDTDPVQQTSTSSTESTTPDVVDTGGNRSSSVPDITCILCDLACALCVGPGPANCTSCAEEYERDNSGTLCVTKGENHGTTTEATSSASEESGVNILLIAGPACAGLLVLVVVVVVVVVVRCCRRRRAAQTREAPSPAKLVDKEEGKKDKGDGVRYRPQPSGRKTRPLSIQWWRQRFSNPYTKDPTRKNPQKLSTTPTATGQEPRSGYWNLAFSIEDSHHTSDILDPIYQNAGDQSVIQSAVDDSVGSDGTYSNGISDPYVNMGMFMPDKRDGDYENFRAGNARQTSEKRKSEVCIEDRPKSDDSGYSSVASSQVPSMDLDAEDRRGSRLEPIKESEHVECKKPTFSDSWQSSQTFSAKGGCLQGSHSDVRLEVPKRAISRENKVQISVSVSTKLDEVHSIFSLADGERMVSPLVEYTADKEFGTERPMTIDLPHVLHPSSSKRLVKVYRFESRDRFALQTLRFVQMKKLKASDDGVFYFDEHNRLLIQTYHFSGYFCTDCNTDCPPVDLWLEVHAKHEKKGRETLATVRLEIWDSRFNIKDFKQDRLDQGSANNTDLQHLDTVKLSRLARDADLQATAVGVMLELKSEVDEDAWHHSRRRNGQAVYPAKRKIPMANFIPCDCRNRKPERLDWQLVATRETDAEEYFSCWIYVGYICVGDFTSDGRPLVFLPDPESQTIDVRVRKRLPAEDVDQNGPAARLAERAPSLNPRLENTRHTGRSPPTTSCTGGGPPSSLQPNPDQSAVSISHVNSVNVFTGSTVTEGPYSLMAAPNSGTEAPAQTSDNNGQQQQEPLYMNFPLPIPATEGRSSLVREV